MNKELTIEKIYNALMQQGKVTSKSDVLGTDPMEDKVFTKKLTVDKELGEGASAIEVKFIAITSDNKEFNNTSSNDVRVNIKNTRNQWCNLFIEETPENILELVEATVC